MAILGIEGFDYFETGVLNLELNDKENYSIEDPYVGDMKISETEQRFGTGKYLRAESAFNEFRVVTSGNSTLFVSFALKPVLTLDVTDFLMFYDTTVGQVHTWLRINPGGTISVRTGNGDLLGTSTRSLTLGNWHWIEVKVVIDGSAGVLQLQVDDTNWLDLSSRNTQAGATTDIGAFALAGGLCDCWFDDLVWQDTSGAFLTNSKVELLIPTDDGTTTNWTNTGGGTNAADVSVISDSTDNVDDDYVYTSTSGHIDSYVYPTIATDSIVKAIAIDYRATKTDAPARSVKSIHSGGASSPGTVRTLTNAYTWYQDVFETTDGSSTAWTQASIDSATFGIEDTS